jgi:PAS domain S-box-containing protein
VQLSFGPSSVAISFLLAALAALTTGLSAFWSSSAIAEATSWVAHTREVQTRLEEVLSLLKDAETSQRGYMLTADPAYLAPYRDADRVLPGSLQALQRLTADNPTQQARLPRLHDLVAAKLKVTREAIGRMDVGDLPGARALMVAGGGKRLMDELRLEIDAMRSEEERLLRLRMEAVDTVQARSAASAGVSTGLLLALLATVYASSQSSAAHIRSALAASEAARRDLEFLEQAVDRAAIVAVSDPQGRLLRVNDAYVHLSGFPRDQLVGQHHRVVLPALEPAFYEAAREGRTWRGEVRSHARNGRAFWTDTTVVPLLDGAGQPERYIAIHYDITDRKLAELSLRESEARYRTLAEALPHMVWTATPGLVPTYFSSHWTAFTGVRSDGWNFERWLSLIHPDDRAHFLQAVEDPMGRGQPHESEFRLRRHDGAWRLVNARATPQRDEAGAIVQWVGTVTDIHDRRQAELALRQSQALVQAIVDGSPALVFAKDLHGRYFLSNRAWRQMLGLSREQADGVTDEQVFGPDIAAQLAAGDRRALEGSEPVLLEESGLVQGRHVTYLSSKFPLRNERGEVYAVGGVATDVTELKNTREEIQRLNAQLEERVQERTRQLSEANQELEAFSYTVSHDLRAPLRGLQGFAQAVHEDYAEKLDAQGRDYLDRIMGAARRMESLIQDLLEYGRLSREELQLRDASLALAVREALQQLDVEVRRRHASVEVQEPLPAVRAHPTVLLQVLSNLLGNALKFVPPGQAPRVRVLAHARDARVRVEVQDNGIGIRPEHQERIFRVFERLHGQEAYAGTGVGLAIVRKGCERMGGTCGVQSAPGQGSTFWVELPASTQGAA